MLVMNYWECNLSPVSTLVEQGMFAVPLNPRVKRSLERGYDTEKYLATPCAAVYSVLHCSGRGTQLVNV